jgi:hypothetical protein
VDLDKKGFGPPNVRLYSDGQFSDITLEEALQSLRSRGEVAVAEFG